MASIEKLIRKMKNQPHGITFNEAERVLEAHGYCFIRRKGSHCSFRNESGDAVTIVDKKDAIKKAYVVEILGHIGETK
jgi:predicted RNA binding protein YcfA (HicA-like mRNA interferase family)